MKIKSLKSGRERTDLGHPLWVIFNVLFIFIISQTLAAVLVQLFTRAINPAATGSIDNYAAAEFFYVLVAEAISIAIVLYIVKRRQLDLSKIGLSRRPTMHDLSRGLIGFGVFYGLLIVASLILSAIFPSINNGSQNVGFNNLNTGLDTFLAFFALVFLPPLGEEVLVRGYLYSGLRLRMKFVPALLITSLMFGVAHLATGNAGALWGAGVNTFLLSVVLVYLRESSGALYAGMLVHMLNNLIAFGVHFHP